MRFLRSGLGLLHAFVGAGIALALLNAAFVVTLDGERASAQTGLHLLYELGHTLALALSVGALGVLLAPALRRLRQKPAIWSVGATSVLALILAWALGLVLDQDLLGFSDRMADAGSTLPWFWLMIGASSCGLLFSTALAWGFLRERWRWLLPVFALCAGVANHLVLEGNYPGIHLLVAITSLIWLAAFFVTTSVGSWAANLTTKREVIVPLVAGVAAATSLLISPSPQVWRDMHRLSGSPLPAFVTFLSPKSKPLPPAAKAVSPWFLERSGVPPVPPGPREGLPDSPIVLFITADALRADLIEDERHAKELPHLTELKRRSVQFTLARSPSPSTATTFTAIYTGKYYSQTRWTGSSAKMASKGKTLFPRTDPTPRVAKLLTDRGVDAVNLEMLNAFGKGNGITTDFSEHIRVGHYAKASEGMQTLVKRLNLQREKPLFLAMHLIDPHNPYNRGKARTTKGGPFRKYLAEVSLVDRQIGKLLDVINASPLRARIILVFSSDHGEAFGEHGSKYHAKTMYEELLRVPLLVYGQDLLPRRVDVPVSLMDLGPTFLDLFGQETPGWFMGHSLVPLLQGETVALDRPIAAEAGRRMQALIDGDGLKAIVDLKRHTQEVYDLKNDPKELHNLAGADKRAAQALANLEQFFQAHQLPGYEPPWRQF